MENNDTGLLLSKQNIALQRQYFNSFTKLRGINVQFRTLKEGTKEYNGYGELDAFYNEPQTVSCIYDEHPTQKSMAKLGWDTELSESPIVIHVPYDLPVQVGCLFSIPSGLDNAEPRLFRVLRMTNIAIYPASIACELGPIWKNNSQAAEVQDFSKSNFNVLIDPEEEPYEVLNTEED